MSDITHNVLTPIQFYINYDLAYVIKYDIRHDIEQGGPLVKDPLSRCRVYHVLNMRPYRIVGSTLPRSTKCPHPRLGTKPGSVLSTRRSEEKDSWKLCA